MSKVSQQEFLKQVQERVPGYSMNELRAIQTAMFGSIMDIVGDGDIISFRGFGKFSVRDVAPRKAVNFVTKQVIELPASKRVNFKPGQNFKNQI